MSFFIKYDSVGKIRVFQLRKINVAGRLKELEVSTADEFIVHQVVNQLPFLFDQLKVNYTTQKEKWNMNEHIAIYVKEEFILNLHKIKIPKLIVHLKPQLNYEATIQDC